MSLVYKNKDEFGLLFFLPKKLKLSYDCFINKKFYNAYEVIDGILLVFIWFILKKNKKYLNKNIFIIFYESLILLSLFFISIFLFKI